jgi:hypothetical protein
MRLLKRLVLLSSLVSTACGDTPEGSLAIVTGDETDVFSRAPQPVTVVTEKVSFDGSKKEINRAAYPIDSIDLGELPKTEVGGIAVTGLDGAGKPIIKGETLFVQWGALETSALEVFVQRTGELARLPRTPGAIDAKTAMVIVGRYVFVTADTTAAIYDLLSLKTLPNQPTLPRPAKSVAAVGTSTVLIDEGGATTFDLSTGQSFQLEVPQGGTFAEVAGGQRISGTDGTQFVVGATRTTGDPTARILTIDSDGNTKFVALANVRVGACATFVEGRGLVVIGGGDSTTPGGELLAVGASIGTPLPLPPDLVKGCGAATLDNSHIVVVGGEGGTTDAARVFDLTCTANCTGTPWNDTSLGALTRTQVSRLSADTALVVGDDKDGATHMFRISGPGGKREIPLKIPRRNARLITTPTNSHVLVGGNAPGIEQYID